MTIDVGKTCIIKRLIHGEFSKEYTATLGCELESKTYEFPRGTIKLHIWDTVTEFSRAEKVGQEQFRSLTQSYFKSAAFAFVVFDLTDHKSFEDVTQWAEMVRSHASHDVPVYVVGNKCDLGSE